MGSWGAILRIVAQRSLGNWRLLVTVPVSMSFAAFSAAVTTSDR